MPLYQRPQHIFSNFAKQRTLVFYEVTRFTDDVKRIKKQADNLYLVNYANTAFSKLLFRNLKMQSSEICSVLFNRLDFACGKD